MKKFGLSILFSILCISSSQAQVIEYAEFLANGSNASSVNLDVIFRVTKDDKSSLYRYTTGRYSGQVEKLCTGETFPFQIKALDGRFEDVNSIWSPIPYFKAYYNITQKEFEPGIRMVTKKSDNGVLQICMEDLKTCSNKE